MKRFSIFLLFALCAAIFLLFLISPDVVQKSAYESVLFCSSVLIPSLFPGFVLSDLLLSLAPRTDRRNGVFSRLFRLPQSLFGCWLIGLLAGFPAAADCSCRMAEEGRVATSDANRVLAFTNNPGIVFVICAVGSGLFGSIFAGLYLWVIQTVSAIMVGIVFAKPCSDFPQRGGGDSFRGNLSQIFPKAVVSSVSAVLNICGFVVFFRVLIDVLTCSVPLDGVRGLFAGLLEMTCGISALTEFNFQSAVVASLILGWSGFSVHFQILNVVSHANLSLKYYFPGKILQALFSAVLTIGTFPLLFYSSVGRRAILLLCPIFLILIIVFCRIRKEFLYGKQNL